MKEPTTKSGKAGYDRANSIINDVHLFYQKQTAKRYLEALMRRLQERIKEFD